jgi:amidase
MSSILDRDPIGAFTRHTHAECRGAPEGPLSGLACGIKDIYDLSGHCTGFGSPDWLATHGPATATATAVRRLLDAGARVVGKTHTDEMAWSSLGENAHYGTPVNVNAPGRIPGGSSSGSAAAVAAGLVDFALGSDTGGSVRFPASLCGVFGMRPTHGRIPLDGVCALAPSYDTAGWFTRDAGLLERVGRVLLADQAAAAAPGSLLLAADAFDWAGDGVAHALRPALLRIEARLGAAEPVRIADEGFAAWAEVFRHLQAAEAWAVHGAWVREVRPQFGPGVRERFAHAAVVDAVVVRDAAALRETISERLSRLLAENAVLVMPTAPGIAPLRGSPQEAMNPFRAHCMGLLSAAGHARLPQVSLPMAALDGCPLGISLLAAPGKDLMLLELARTVVG